MGHRRIFWSLWATVKNNITETDTVFNDPAKVADLDLSDAESKAVARKVAIT